MLWSLIVNRYHHINLIELGFDIIQIINGMRKMSNDLQVLTQLQCDQIDIVKIKQQRQIVNRIQQSLLKKDQEISKLKSLLEKYQQYQQKYTSLKVQLHQKNQLLTRKDTQCKLYQTQLQQLIHQHQLLQQKLKSNNIQKSTLLKQRHSLQITNKQIEATFKEYQGQCRKRQNNMNYELERAYQQIKELYGNVDQLEIKVQVNNRLEIRVQELELQLRSANLTIAERQLIKNTPEKKQEHKTTTPSSQTNRLLQEITTLQSSLLQKQQQLTSYRALNYQLTIQYDQSINSLCQLQSQLSSYRKQNNELKKIMSLLRQKQKCQEIELKYSKITRSGGRTKYVTPQSDYSINSEHQEEQSEQVGIRYENSRNVMPAQF